jgi:hypothetical protein
VSVEKAKPSGWPLPLRVSRFTESASRKLAKKPTCSAERFQSSLP